jgi:general secretion pathway protein G
MRVNKGFTVIEIMIVLSIIGLLAAIALPKYQNYKTNAEIAIVKNDISKISQLLKAYHLEASEYPNSLADIGLGSMKDPWGTVYQYYDIEKNGRGHARKDRRLNPLNSDFDLYSMGKDKKTKSQISQKDSVDDVIRANDGRFIDLASNY